VKRNILKVLLLAFLFSAFLGWISVEASATTGYERLFYFREGPNARKSFFAHPSSIDIFAPQNYMIDKEGKLLGNVKADLLNFAKKNKIKVMPLLTNGNFHATTSKTFLDNINKQDILINNLVQEAKDFGYYGWQIDFEQMDLSYRDKFSAFVDRTYQKFKSNNLKLSVAVIAQVSENPVDYPKDLWRRIIGVYDYAKLASSTDFISLMSYDDPYSTGPVASNIWLNQVIVHSLAKIPPEKLSLGLAFYYWQWRDIDGKRVGIGGNEGISNVLAKYKATFNYDSLQQAPYFHYWSKDGKGYTIWYENAKSIGQKISLVKKYKLQGFSAWALGLELPSVYSVMK
jgi:spore germination protein YaaH